MRVLLAGGAGYIGSHTALALLNAGHDVIIVDNYCNSSPESVRRVEELAGRPVDLHEADVRDSAALLRILSLSRPDSVIHFAGLKAVGESVRVPLAYYRNNLDATLTLLECMDRSGVRSIVFSSSATVYGEDAPVPYAEGMPRGRCSNPYGWTKSMIEQILEDAAFACGDLSVVLLRYFNPVGAHESGRIGEDPRGIPNNLMPFISQVAVGRRECLYIFGNDYPTPDGTCRRDFIHVMDLAEGHAQALEYGAGRKGVEIFNLGTGTPYSVLEMLRAFEKACGFPLKHAFTERREGDLPEFWADAGKAKRVLDWQARRSLDDMCRDAWNWQKQNPMGYQPS